MTHLGIVKDELGRHRCAHTALVLDALTQRESLGALFNEKEGMLARTRAATEHVKKKHTPLHA